MIVNKVNKMALARARVNIKSLASEAGIIRSEIKNARLSHIKNDLHHHRMEKVRPEARLANLAIAYIKGRKIEDVERAPSEKKIDVKRLKNKLSSFIMWTGFSPPSEEDIRNWIGNR